MTFAVLLWAATLAACRSAPLASDQEIPGFDPVCMDLIGEFRRQVRAAQASDAGAPVLPALPLLHTNRFLSSLAPRVQSPEQRREWVSMLARLGTQVRAGENANLLRPWPPGQLDRLEDCGRLAAIDARYDGLRNTLANRLADNPVVRDHYSGLKQALGLLPLLRPIFKWRIRVLHRQEQQRFAARESFQQARDYTPADPRPDLPENTVREWFSTAYAASPLNLPVVSPEQLQLLFRHHAPNLRIDTRGANDAPGAPGWRGDRVHIDTSIAAAWVLPSFTRFAGRNLLQLNYVFWFPERKATALVDLYAGKVDSLIWRVTLDESGEPLLYDSIHSCGCYHKYFMASDGMVVKNAPASKEPANVFDVRHLDRSRPPRLVLSANEHFIVGLDNEAPLDGSAYSLRSYQELARLPKGERQASLFDHRGIVPGSQRLERFTLWPAGIENTGAMRQWGTHAVGFVERQHFDDADIFDDYFARRE